MPAPSGSTSKYGFPFLLETDVPDVATASQDLAQAIENIIATAYQGVAASRPAAGKAGRYYFATDTTELSYDNGTTWTNLGSVNTSAGNIAALTFGDSAAAGSTGLVADAGHVHAMPAAPAFLTAHTYAVSGSIVVPSGASNYMPPFYEPVLAGNSKTLVSVRCSIRAGTSVTFAVKQNGANVSGLSSVVANTSATTTNASTSPTVANGDAFAIVVSAVSGTPDGLSVSLNFETVV